MIFSENQLLTHNTKQLRKEHPLRKKEQLLDKFYRIKPFYCRLLRACSFLDNQKGVRCEGLRCLEQVSAHEKISSRPNPVTRIPPFCLRVHEFGHRTLKKEEKADGKQITLVALLCKTERI